MSELYQFDVFNAKEEPVHLSKYANKWLLIVNTASHCGFTNQYEGLQKLYSELKPKLEIIAFPCNQFCAQEPGLNDEIQSFCQLMFKIEFPVMAKINVNGKEAEPLFTFLKKSKRGILGTKSIKWNFTKFLISPSGEVLKRYGPRVTPEKISDELAKLMI